MSLNAPFLGSTRARLLARRPPRHALSAGSRYAYALRIAAFRHVSYICHYEHAFPHKLPHTRPDTISATMTMRFGRKPLETTPDVGDRST